MIGPVATIVFGSWILGEPVTAWQIAGAAVVLCGIYLLSRQKTSF
jgi:drug/metabolite transporter (DMT)-like permease